MKKTFFLSVLLFLFVALFSGAAISREKRDRVDFKKHYYDPVLEKMREDIDHQQSVADSITAVINKKWKNKKKKDRDERMDIRFDFGNVKKPESPDVFNAPFHYAPVAQYHTGTCWSFAATSFMESEAARLTGQKIKLSEIYTVYWEYVEKARGYIQKRGHQRFSQGSEPDVVLIIWDKYGIVPHDVCTGLLGDNDKHSHERMYKEMHSYLEYVKEKGYWDEAATIKHIRVILDRYIGRPPETFEYDGKTVTPKEFLRDVLKIHTEDYVRLISTLSVPFYTRDEFKVPDNWRPITSYHNVPLDEFYGYIKKAAQTGYTVSIGGDVSEPGYNGFEDAAIIPTFDIPQDYIDQDSREFRFYNRTTTDDHCLHLLAHKSIAGRDWYLVKDSARSARHGAFEGYYFYRDDYIKLKILTCMIHKDVVSDMESKFETKAAGES